MREISAAMAEILSANIKLLRKRLGMDQTVFGELVEVAQGSVARWESGQSKPRIDSLLKLAKLAGCAPDEMVTRLLDDDVAGGTVDHQGGGRAVLLPVQLPSEDALTAMFSALLAPLHSEIDPKVIARLLAQRLPNGLAQAVGRTVYSQPDQDVLPPAPPGEEHRLPKDPAS